MPNRDVGSYPVLNNFLNVLHDVLHGLASDKANAVLACAMDHPVGFNCQEVDNKGCQRRNQANLINAGRDPLLDVCLATSGLLRGLPESYVLCVVHNSSPDWQRTSAPHKPQFP